MARLPTPGSDDGTWGNILNDFLNVEHNADGSLKVRTDGAIVPPSRQITAGTGISGGGDLSTDRTLSVTPDSTTQKVEVALGGTLTGTRKRLNFISGSNISVSTADDTTNNKVDITLATTGTVTQSARDEQRLATQRAQPLMRWTSDLADRHYKRCNVVCLGDSITEGQGATQVDRRWLARLRDNLRARFQTTGISGGGRGFLGAVSTGTVSFTWPSTVAGSPTIASSLGPKSQFLQLNGAGQSVTYSLVGDSADIMWTQVPFGGTFSWQVDGGVTTNVSTNGGSIVDGQLTHVAFGSGGAHTLVIAWVSGASNIDGVIEFNGDYASGVQVHDAGHYGWQSSDWAAILANGTNSPASAIDALNPAVIVITLGVNDQYSGVTPAAFQSNLALIISRLRAVATAPHPSIILNMMPPRTGQSGYTYPWSQYVDAAWSAASADTGGAGGSSLVTVMDFTLGPRMLGAESDIYGGWPGGDPVHPSDKGHSMVADYIAAFLSLP